MKKPRDWGSHVLTALRQSLSWLSAKILISADSSGSLTEIGLELGLALRVGGPYPITFDPQPLASH